MLDPAIPGLAAAGRTDAGPRPRTVVVVSGYFNPLHRGHLTLLEEAGALGDRLVVVVNNDAQQQLKKGKVIMTAEDRVAIVAALRVVDEVVLAVDEDASVRATLGELARRYDGDRLVFANGGDRSSAAAIAEAEVCARLGIELAFGVGGEAKQDSSTRINVATGDEVHAG